MSYGLALYLIYALNWQWLKQKPQRKQKQWYEYTEEYGEELRWSSHLQASQSRTSNKGYEPMFRKYQIKTEMCPVCDENLGQRDASRFFMAKCDECQFYYSWEVGQDKPRAISAKDKEKKECGCSGCKRLGR